MGDWKFLPADRLDYKLQVRKTSRGVVYLMDGAELPSPLKTHWPDYWVVLLEPWHS
jgi:hypothetical protein